MNDPCAPCYNPKTKTFHLFYQWNPKATQWGDIAWGHVQSDDLLRWKYTHQEVVRNVAALMPAGSLASPAVRRGRGVHWLYACGRLGEDDHCVHQRERFADTLDKGAQEGVGECVPGHVDGQRQDM